MKNSKRASILVFVFLTYQLELNAFMKQSFSHSLFNHEDNSGDSHYSLMSANLYCLPWKTEDQKGQKSNAGTNNINSSGISLMLDDLVGNIYLKCSLSRYILYTVNIVIHFRKNDIVFPFHYFW
ncbi:MAG: hypothetical protein ACM3PT_05140 [Deltaproteobacteria bacterium]